MAPMLLEYPEQETHLHSKMIPICSDPSVVVSVQAPKESKELWWLHGHPHSKQYLDPALNCFSALIRHDGVVHRGQKAFLYPLSPEATTEYGSITWDEFDMITESLALSYATQLTKEIREANLSTKQPTVALLGAGRTVEYFCTQLALQKLGVRVLLLAESNAPDSLHHLLEVCDAIAVITSSGSAGKETNGVRKIDMIESLPKAPRIKSGEVDAVKFQNFGDVWEQHSFIIHSSGSTGMPKPIVHTNRSMMLIARMYRLFQDFEVNNWFLLFPLYHIAGISVAISNLPNGKILSFPPLVWPPSSSSIFAAWKTLAFMGHPVDITHCAPTIIENMYEYITSTSKDFTPLTSLKVLQPGGAALSETIVKALTTAGVNVKTTYGSTEIGPPFRTIPHSRSNTKCYTFRNLYPDSPFIKMEKVGEGIFECIVYKGFELAAELWEGKSDDEPYRTNDLFVEVPPASGNFVLQGRRDDILVHSNGENTSAGPLQLDIQTSSRYIAKAIAFGHSKPCVSLLVELHAQFNPEDEEIRSSVWEAIKEVNQRHPSHSQVMQDMICFLPKGSALPVTPKGNVKRKEAERTYSREITALYDEDVPQLTSTEDTTHEQPLSMYIRDLFASMSKLQASKIQNWTTLHELGIDSQLALCVRSQLSKRLSRPISLSMIFENPSISQLLSAITASATSSAPASMKPSDTETVNRIISRLETEIRSWPSHAPHLAEVYPQPVQETILLTGASGSLGTALLETLFASSRVTKIYALVRGPNHLAKLQKSMNERGIDVSILDKGGKIEVLNFSMQDPLLGLGFEEYSLLAREVTIVIGNAWKMDFNLGVEEFEVDCIRNMISLLRLCHAGRPKTLAFTSSISTCMGAGHIGPQVGEEPISSDPTVSLSTGYALSKYIIERTLHIASSIPSLSHLPMTILRVGQLCGHTQTKFWNLDEMWPIMFVTAWNKGMRCLPNLGVTGQVVDWVPVDVAARTIEELLLTSGEVDTKRGYRVFNVVNPKRVPWGEVVGMLRDVDATTRITAFASSTATLQGTGHPRDTQQQENTELELVSMKEWVRRLNLLADSSYFPNPTTTSVLQPLAIPGLKLLSFFESMAENTSLSSSKYFQTEKTEAISQSLRELEGFEKAGWRDMLVFGGGVGLCEGGVRVGV